MDKISQKIWLPMNFLRIFDIGYWIDIRYWI